MGSQPFDKSVKGTNKRGYNFVEKIIWERVGNKNMKNNFFKGLAKSRQKNVDIRRTAREKARIIFREMPLEFTLRTDKDTLEERYATEEEIVNELVSTYKRFGSKSDLSRIWKNLGRGSYEYVDYITNLQRKKINSNESFYQKYKEEEYNGVKIKNYLERFRLGLITKDTLNDILSKFKLDNEKYKKSSSS